MQNVQEFLDLLGYRAKDRVTGFSGVITSVVFDLFGCIQVSLCTGIDDKGLVPERGSLWFDTNRIEVDRAAGRVMEFKLGERYVETNPGCSDSRPW